MLFLIQRFDLPDRRAFIECILSCCEVCIAGAICLWFVLFWQTLDARALLVVS